ncbi:hypothetical protein E2C01_095062 [Portunus trituberculatus]|uniref:Uncharacterized protein n=1 Tax=Portunus trituberculatus TaxID=210409 RepID=A0A5B7JYJ4_PORTR|nr:hypothetical protein [Portunus trituberculatus]
MDQGQVFRSHGPRPRVEGVERASLRVTNFASNIVDSREENRGESSNFM